MYSKQALPVATANKFQELTTKIDVLKPYGIGTSVYQSRIKAAQAQMKTMTEQWRDYGVELDFAELTYLGERSDVRTYLQGHGWQATAVGANDLLTGAGLSPAAPAGDEEITMADVRYITATR